MQKFIFCNCRLLFLITLFLYSFCAIAQPSQLIFDRYTTDDGLSDNGCHKVVQDEDGFIWVATNSGLNRFDGKDFIKFYSNGSTNSLPNNYINTIVHLPQHKLAIGTMDGIGILNTVTGVCKNIYIPADSSLYSTTNAVTDIISDKDSNLVVGTSAGIYIFNSALQLIFRYDAFTKEDIGRKRLLFKPDLYLLPDGRVIAFASNGIIYVINSKKRTLQNIKDITGHEFDGLKKWNGNTSSIKGGNKYGQFFFINVTEHIDSLYVVDLPHQKTSASALHFPAVTGIDWSSKFFMLNDTLLCLSAQLNNNAIYLMRYDVRTLKTSYIKNILQESGCWDMITDNNNRIWICCYDGIYKQSFLKASFHNIEPEAETPGSVAGDMMGFIHYGNRYFILKDYVGLLIYDDSLHYIKTISLFPLVNNNHPWNISYYKKDTLLVTTASGILLFNTNDYSLKRFIQPGMPDVIDKNAITCSFIDSYHQLWMGIAAGNGLFRMNTITHEWKYFSPQIPNAVFKFRYPWNIVEDNTGKIWMSSHEGITRWNQQKQTFDTVITQLPYVGNIIGLANMLTIDAQNNLWIIEKDFILIKWNLNTGKFTAFPRPSNIPSSETEMIAGPWHNCLWITTEENLLSFNITTQQYQLIKKTDGLFDNQVKSDLYFDTSTQRLFTGFTNVFTWFYPDSVLKARKPLQPIITSIKRIGDSASLEKDSALSFSYDQNSFEFNFTGINYDDGQSNTYEYRLFEKKPAAFIRIGSQKTVTFANLQPGKYTFQVKAVLSDGTVSSKPASVYFSIAYPFFETWWFYVLMTISFAAILYLLYRSRINQLLKLQTVRNNISADLHDDIGARLTNINLLSALGEQKIHEPLEASDYLKRIATEVQSSGEALDDIVWSINTRNDSMNEITARMRRYAAEIFDSTSIQYSMYVDAMLARLKLPMEKRRNLFLIYKEAINNVYKHASASEVKINITITNHILIMEISDNGKGFDLQQPTHRNGLKNMQYRMQKSGGSVIMNSSPGNGTTIQIKLPVTGASPKRSIWVWMKIK